MHLSFYDWVHSLNMMSSKFIQVEHSRISFFSKTEKHPIVCIQQCSLSICIAMGIYVVSTFEIL